jgi:hypothetical protein
MQYALLIYGERSSVPMGQIAPGIAAVLERPYVSAWARLQSDESATTVRVEQGQPLLTDGPFIDSKEYLAGIIVVDVADLDEALAVAQELEEARGIPGAIEVRPIFEGLFGGA